MRNSKAGIAILALVAAAAVVGGYMGWRIRHQPAAPQEISSPEGQVAPEAYASKDILRATYDPIHFRPAIETARDEQCLACHREVLDDKVRETSPAGINASTSKAWYQRLSTYAGDQDTFHRRHLKTAMAKDLMNFSCTTCHQEMTRATKRRVLRRPVRHRAITGSPLRKTVNTEQTCLQCHGPMNVKVMGLPGPWPESKEMFGDSCLTCHAAIRTNRHQVSYLKAEAIEAAGQKNADVCFGCHGGRAWYRIEYPYPRHPWEGMALEVPDWAKDRPLVSEARFALPANGNQPRQ